MRDFPFLSHDSTDSARPMMRDLRSCDDGNPLHGRKVQRVWNTSQIAQAFGGLWSASLSAAATLIGAGNALAARITADMLQAQSVWGAQYIAVSQAITNYVTEWNNFYTQAHIEQWVEKDAQEHTVDDGTSPGGRYYLHMKKQLQKQIDSLKEPARTLARQFIINHGSIQDFLRSDQMADHFDQIDDKIRAAYGTYFKKQFPECARDPHLLQQKLDAKRWHGTLFDPKYNHKFLAENSKGEIVEVTQETIASWFPKGAKDFPHVILTSSHAQGEKLEDVRSMIHGYAAQALHSGHDEAALKLKHIDQGVGPGDTVIIYACDVRETPWKNGAALLRRVNELKRIGNKPDTQFKDASPGAFRLAKLMLKCKCEEPERIDAQDMLVKPAEGGIASGDAPIVLRPDAGVIAHHFQPMGYSKGGNVISDAGRYGNYILSYKKPDGAELFRMHPEHPVCKITNNYGMNEKNIRNIMRGHTYIADAAVEVGLSDWDIACGMVRKAVNNMYDLISCHHNYVGDYYRDHRLVVQGATDHHGHAPDTFLGKKRAPENPDLTREMFERGYKLDNPISARDTFENFAPNYGKAAIGHVSFKEGAKNGTIIVEPSPGTLDASVMDHAEKIKIALGNALGKVVTLEEDPINPGRIVLKCPGTDFEKNADALNKLGTVFSDLQDPKVKGLVISQLIDAEIKVQLEEAKAKSRVKHSPSTSGRAAT